MLYENAWRSFQGSFGKLTTSPNKKHYRFSPELADDDEMTASSDITFANFQPAVAKRFVDEREPIAEDLATHLKASRSNAGEAQGQELLKHAIALSP